MSTISTLNINDIVQINAAETLAEFSISLEDKSKDPDPDFGFYPSKVSGFFKQGAGRTKGAMCHATELKFILVNSVSNYAKTREDFNLGDTTISARVEIYGYERKFIEIDGVERAYWEEYKGITRRFSNIFYDNYLKANKQPDGMKTYNRMIILTMTYYKKRGLLTPP